ncbi:MAG: TlpA disulfide reductase family protein [Phycisphaerae bacterium]|nr:TlpA disulfide reductase family protein [Phycisphaerae bacterium]
MPSSQPTSHRSVIVRILAIPTALVAIVAVMGGTGACPLCSGLCSSVTSGFEAFRGGDGAAVAGPLVQGSPASPPASTPDVKPPASPDVKPNVKPDATPAAPTLGPMHAAIYRDLDNKVVDLADAAGKPMIIELWATWCGPCVKQRAVMHRLSTEYEDGVFVALSVDEKGAQHVKSWITKNRATNPHESKVRDLMATPEVRALISRRNSAGTIPQVIYVSRKGEILDVSVGGQAEPFMRAMFKNLGLKTADQKAADQKKAESKDPAAVPGSKDQAAH